MSINIEWQWLSFEQFTVDLLYEVLKLRQDVFIIEQACIYPELDDNDQPSLHLLGKRDSDGAVVAYLRLLPEGISYEGYCSIGRVLMAQDARGLGLGRKMMALTIEKATQAFPGIPIKLSGQEYLKAFYESLGFRVVAGPYDEDGIPHLAMVRDA